MTRVMIPELIYWKVKEMFPIWKEFTWRGKRWKVVGSYRRVEHETKGNCKWSFLIEEVK